MESPYVVSYNVFGNPVRGGLFIEPPTPTICLLFFDPPIPENDREGSVAAGPEWAGRKTKGLGRVAGLAINRSPPMGVTRRTDGTYLSYMSEPPEKQKWSKEKVFLFFATMIFLFIGIPLLIILYVVHLFSGIH
jgi:hypothetical protein